MTSARNRSDRRDEPLPLRRVVRWPVAGVGLLITASAALTLQLTVAVDTPVIVVAAVAAGLAVTLGTTAIASLGDEHTDKIEKELSQTSRQANLDQLTGLPNRHGLLRALEVAVTESLRDSTALGVLFLDLDRFKVINDTMGHETGDDLLKQVAKRIAGAVRASDIVARFGGDEFVVICRGLLTGDSSVAIARQILHAFEAPVPLKNGVDHVVTPSIGVATMDKFNPRTSRELVRDADVAMYRAKREKTGLSVFDEAQRRDALGRLDIEQALRIALEDSKLDVHYQPIVESRDRSLAAFEALVRWNRPGMGLVSPGSFLGVAEEAGLIAPLGELVLREAVAQTSIWNHGLLSARQAKVGVNVAERQLIDPQFVAKVERVLNWAALPPWLLTLEITEDVIMEHLDSSLSVLRDLKRLGVNLAIDDFGTGRSSLSYVRRLDMVDVLKIDKSFVNGLGQDSVDEAIVQAIVAMANALGLEMVAEGVETETQFEILQELGVQRVQGFLFHRPLPAADLEFELRNNQQLVPPPAALEPAPVELPPGPVYAPGMASPFRT